VMATLNDLAQMYCGKDEIISQEMVQIMVQVTNAINKEIAIYIDRNGKVELISVGSHNRASLPNIWRKRSEFGLNGIRVIHTHPSASSALSAPDLSALCNLHLDLMCAIGVNEDKLDASVAFIVVQDGALSRKVYAYQHLKMTEFYQLNPLSFIEKIEKELNRDLIQIDDDTDRAIMVGVLSGDLKGWEEDDIFAELYDLCKTAKVEVVGKLVQKKDRPDHAFYLGKGKLEELSLMVQNLNANCVVFEQPLSPAQQSNLENALNVKVIDKTVLILDIFATRAQSREGQLQVELAQLSYLLPRLVGKGTELSRLGGGVGTRGPGETKLESDRRHIRRRIDTLNADLEQVRKQRHLKKKKRLKNQLPQVALVGYTNAGKSSLLNTLTNDAIYAEDELFATLDTTTRSMDIDGKNILLSDTVGFIRDLPKQLVEAFKATLEELEDADLLLHVIDGSNPKQKEQIAAVDKILYDLNLKEKPMLYVINKVDRVLKEAEEQTENIPYLITNELPHDNYCLVSAKEKWGIDKLKEKIGEILFQGEKRTVLLLPYDESGMLNTAYQYGKVENLTYQEQGIVFEFVAENFPKNFEKYILEM